MKEKVKFAFHVLTHPFDGFWDLKREGKGSLLLAFIFIFLWILSNVITQEVTSFLFNETALQLVDISVEIQKVLVVFILFCVGNWSITTLMEGEGSFKDIVMVFGYSCLPLSLINIPLAFLSLVFTYSESVYYSGSQHTGRRVVFLPAVYGNHDGASVHRDENGGYLHPDGARHVGAGVHLSAVLQAYLPVFHLCVGDLPGIELSHMRAHFRNTLSIDLVPRPLAAGMKRERRGSEHEKG